MVWNGDKPFQNRGKSDNSLLLNITSMWVGGIAFLEPGSATKLRVITLHPASSYYNSPCFDLLQLTLLRVITTPLLRVITTHPASSYHNSPCFEILQLTLLRVTVTHWLGLGIGADDDDILEAAAKVIACCSGPAAEGHQVCTAGCTPLYRWLLLLCLSLAVPHLPALLVIGLQ